jgi:hypothetical protein
MAYRISAALTAVSFADSPSIGAKLGAPRRHPQADKKRLLIKAIGRRSGDFPRRISARHAKLAPAIKSM